MGRLKEVVKNSLEMKNVGPQIISNVDTLLARSTIRLQQSNILPARTLEFTSKDRKQEKRDGDDLLYNFYYLPEDFRKLDEFRPMKNYPYHWESDEHELYREKDENYSESDLKKLRNKFTIVNNNFDEDSKYEKILIAFPFPDDDETIQLKYYVNGKDLDYDWIDSALYEAVIADIEQMIGLRASGDPETEQRISQAVEQSKEFKGQGSQGRQSLNGSLFGKRSRNVRRRNNKNNLYDMIPAKTTSRDIALDNFRNTTVDETSADLIKSGEGNLYGYNLINPNSSDVFAKFFDVDGGATLGTDSPVFTVQLPANSSVVVGVQDLPQLHFNNRLEIAATGAIGDTDTTAITSDVVAHVQYA